MENTNQDVKIGAESSPASAVEGATSQQTPPAESSTAKPTTVPSEKIVPFEEAMKTSFKTIQERQEAETQTAAEKVEESEAQLLSKTPEQQAEAVEKEGETELAKEEPLVQKEDDEKGPVPYDRFQEVVHKRQELETELKRVEPVVKMQEALATYCQQNNLTNDDFVQAMEIAALMKSDPAAAWERLKPLAESAGVLTGDKLPDDLVEEVEAGTLSRARAQEIAQFRAKQQYQGQMAQATAKQQQERAQREFVVSVKNAWTGWDAAKQKLDPDFKPGTNGLYELVSDRLTAMTTAVGADGRPLYPIRTPDDAVAIAESAYKFVMQTKKKLVPSGATRDPLSSVRSSQQTPTTPLQEKTFEGAMRARARQLGIVG